jgi:hypothetical protein
MLADVFFLKFPFEQEEMELKRRNAISYNPNYS